MIRLINVSKSFKGNFAVKNLSLEVPSGKILGLLGANGAGKSTTINMLLGFLKPDSGTVAVDEISSSKYPAEARRNIGYIPENVNLYGYLSGLENLEYFCRLAGLKYSKAELSEYLTLCGLAEVAHRKAVSTYSKGMRQKVGIAIAYAKKAKVYLLDEPASGLDPLASNELGELLKKLASEGSSILMASHDIFRVREICDTIGILKAGELVKQVEAENISASELESLYLQFMKN